MLRPARPICAAAVIVLVASGCSWQQAYHVSQAWQCNSCTRLVEQTGRDGCLSNSNMSYDDYRRQTEGAKKDYESRGGGYHVPSFAEMKVTPRLRSLHADLRWITVLRKMGLAD